MFISAHSADSATARIEQLAIQGIRSFDNTRREAIHFNTPLTLIVGYNGSGKTTVIECLKYATTGILPPNCKGGAFIHDPKLVGEKEILAMVKLSFRSTNGAGMVTSRRLQLTAKKSGPPTQKTLEGSLMMHKGGERTALSSRNGELEQLVPHYLGVSKAVLDSVIFCHQDDSLWPMSEPSKLKAKFDHIFEALKYTKAIENIKDLRKAYTAECNQEKIRETQAKENKVMAERNAKKTNDLWTQIEVLRSEATDLDEQARVAEEHSRQSHSKASTYYKDVEILKSKREYRKILQGIVNGLLKDLKERNESDEWLQSELDHYSERMAIHAERERKQTEGYQTLQQKLDSAQARLKAKYSDEGSLKNEKASHERLIQTRLDMIQEKASRHNIRGYDRDLDDEDIEEFMNKVSKSSKDQKSSVAKVRQETEVEVQRVQDTLNGLREQRSALSMSAKSAKERSSANDSRIESSRLSLKKLKVDEGGAALLKASMEGLNKQLQEANWKLSSVSWDSELQKADMEVRSIEEEARRLDEELAQVTSKASELAGLDLLKKNLSQSQKDLETREGAHRERLRKLIGQDWSPSTLKAEYKSVVYGKEKELTEAKVLRDAVSRKLERVHDKLKSSRIDLERGQKEQERCTRDIREKAKVEPEGYLQALQECQDFRDVRKADVDGFAAEQDFYGKCLEAANVSQRCRTCQRPFQNNEEKTRFEQRMKALLQREQKDLEKELEEYENDLRCTKDASLSHTTWLRLSTSELPRIRADIKKLEVERNALLGELEVHDQTVADREQSKADVETLEEPVATIDGHHKEIERYTSDIQKSAAKQKNAGLSRTVDEVRQELQAANMRLNELRAKIAKLKEDRGVARSQVNKVELELSELKIELTRSNNDLEKKADLERQIQELRHSNESERECIKRLREEITNLEPLIAQEETKLSDVRQRGLNKENSLQEEASRLSDSVHRLGTISQQIRDYIDGGGPGRLAACRREIERLERESNQIQDEQTEVTRELNKIRNELQNQQETKRNIDDNINFRARRRELEDVKSTIAKLEAANAEADLAEHQKSFEYWDQQKAKLRGEAERKQVMMAGKDEQLQELISEYDQFYTNAAKEFKERHIKVETTKAAIEDLGRYGAALDKAIMKFHSIKMEEINRIIEELWRKTYQGTDVDSILIRSDNESARGSTYNYRVCMIKSDVEMDMRGRCSAGQKVLASIIIRLALAECFGVNCGLIALDEPTTNLDRDNIRSLAESLHDIIRARQQQANFQLIVITHDEEFLKFMKCADFCDDYYRVSRDDRQKSKIEKQSIGLVL